MLYLFYSIIFFIFLSLTTIQAQIYTVIKVEPKESATVENKIIKVGDKVSPNAKIQLHNSGAFIRVFDGKKTATIQRSGTVPEVLMQSRTFPSSSLAGNKSVITDLNDLDDLFQLNKPLLIIDSLQISIPKSLIVLNQWNNTPKNAFCFISYLHRGIEINKYLSVIEGNSILIDENILSVSGQKVEMQYINNMVLKYAVDATTDKILSEGIELVFIKGRDLIDEIKLLIDLSEEQSNNTFEIILNYLRNFYGSPEISNLKDWLFTTFEKRF